MTAPISVAADLIDREEARDAANRELSDPRYAADDPTLLQRGLQWVFEKVADLLDRAVSAVPGGVWGLVIVALVLGGVGIALAIAGRRVLSERRAAVSTGAVFDDDGPLTAADHRRLAEEAEGEGRWSDAVRFRFRASIRTLEERTVLQPRPGRTADEAAREAGGALGAVAEFDAAARLFDAVCFGGRRATEDQAASVRRLDELSRSPRREALR